MSLLIITGNKQIKVVQADIAKELNLSRATVNEWFSHKRPLPEKYKETMKKYKVPLRIFRKAAA